MANGQNSEEKQPFDWKSAGIELAETQTETAGPKLPFLEQCLAFAALTNKIKPSVVALAFGLTRTAISQLHGCLHPTSRRYRRVRDEFAQLGEDAFMAKYYDNALHVRIAKAKHDVDQERARRIYGAPNPKARAHDSKERGAFEPLEGEFYAVRWLPVRLPDYPIAGWFFSPCQADATKPELAPGWIWHGIEANAGGEFRPFRTSTLAWRAVYEYCNRLPPSKYT